MLYFDKHVSPSYVSRLTGRVIQSKPAKLLGIASLITAFAAIILWLGVGSGKPDSPPASPPPVVTTSSVAPEVRPVLPPNPPPVVTTSSVAPEVRPVLPPNPSAPPLKPMALERWIREELQDNGYIICRPSGVPKNCDFRITLTERGVVILLSGPSHDEQLQPRVRSILRKDDRVKGVQWQRPKAGMVEQWIREELQGYGFSLCSSSEIAVDCGVRRIVVVDGGLVQITAIVADRAEKQVMLKLIQAILGVKEVKPSINTRDQHIILGSNSNG